MSKQKNTEVLVRDWYYNNPPHIVKERRDTITKLLGISPQALYQRLYGYTCWSKLQKEAIEQHYNVKLEWPAPTKAKSPSKPIAKAVASH